MSETLIVREADVADAEAIAGLITELGYPTSPASMTKRLKGIIGHSERVTFVAEAGGSIVGLAGGSIGQYYEDDDPLAQLVVLVVSAGSRKQGVGSRLVKTVERWAAKRGACAVIVTSGLARADTHRFYEARGYVRNGVRFRRPLSREE